MIAGLTYLHYFVHQLDFLSDKSSFISDFTLLLFTGHISNIIFWVVSNNFVWTNSLTFADICKQFYGMG